MYAIALVVGINKMQTLWYQVYPSHLLFYGVELQVYQII